MQNALTEPQFSTQKRWLALQGPFLTGLAENWTLGDGVANLAVTFASTFLPMIHPSHRQPLARACFKAVHGTPATDQTPLSVFPDLMVQHLSEYDVPAVVAMLRRGLELSDGLGLKPYIRKKDRYSAVSHPGLALCVNALVTLTAHPEWRDYIDFDVKEHALPAKRVKEVVTLLDGLWLTRLKREPKESVEAYLNRLEPLSVLVNPRK